MDSLPTELSGNLKNLIIKIIVCVCVCVCSVVSDSETPWTVAYQGLLSMGLSREEYWSGLPFPSLADLHDPGIKPESLALREDSLPTESQGKPFA